MSLYFKKVKSMIMRLLQSVLGRVGFQLVRSGCVEPVDLRGKDISPDVFPVYSYSQPVLIDVSLSDLRALPVFSFSPDGHHPFVIAVHRAVRSSSPEVAIKETLREFYAIFQPVSAADLLGLGAHNILSAEPAWAAVMPWNEESISVWKSNQQAHVLMENSRCGKRFGVENGWAWCGPVSGEKLDVESQRLFDLYVSIDGQGYTRNNGVDGDILAYALSDGQQWVYQVQGAQHRMAVVAGLVDNAVPIRVLRTVYRSQARYWPNVVSGLYSEKDAKAIFDRLFCGFYPEAAAPWIKASSRLMGSWNERGR